MSALREGSSREVKESIESALKKALSGFDTEEYTEAFHAAMQQVELM